MRQMSNRLNARAKMKRTNSYSKNIRAVHFIRQSPNELRREKYKTHTKIRKKQRPSRLTRTTRKTHSMGVKEIV